MCLDTEHCPRPTDFKFKLAGTYWIGKDGVFNRTCLENGEIDAVECIIPSGKHLAVGEGVVVNNKKYE